MTDAIIALDQGTTSSRALVFDAQGRELGKAQHEFAQHFPGPGCVEHDAEEIWQTQSRALEEAWAASGRPEVVAVGITNQRETVVVFDRASGKPIHRAIVWQDRRTTRTLQQLAQAGHDARVRELTGLPLDPYFSAAKIAAILDAVPGARARAERGEVLAATIDAWLVWKLTGGRVFATEPSNAHRTSLVPLATGQWSDELCAIFRVPRACLPEIRDSACPFGSVAGRGWSITGVLGDQQAALFGQGCLVPGAAKCTYGTGAFLLANAGAEPPRPAPGLLATVAWRVAGTTTYALEASVLVAGSLVQWLRDELGLIGAAKELEPLARSVPDSGGVVLVPAFQGLGSPHWDPDARGVLIGLSRATTKAHVARAALEAIALSVDEVVALFPGMHELRVDGGVAANRLLLELQAALAGVPVVRAESLESTALGAARIAMLGAGLVASVQQLPALPAAQLSIASDPAVADTAGLRRRWRAAVERSRGWATLL